jgi:rhamnosyltransferase
MRLGDLISDKMNCSIIIRCFNEEKHIGKLLHGILQQTLKDVEIILVDSGSTDHTLQIASAYPVKIVHIRPEEFTFGYSLNRGISEAKHEFIVMASAHVYPVYPDWLEQLFKPFENPKIALTYGKQRGNEKTHFSEHQIFATWFPNQAQPVQRHPFCNNANAAIRRSLWEINSYDENLTGLEDLGWANWCIQQSYLIAYVPEAEIIHVHEETHQSIFNRYRREAMAFHQIYPDQKFGWFDFIRLFSMNASSDLRLAYQQGCLRRHFREIIAFRYLQFYGTYRGYCEKGPLTWKLRKAFYYPGLKEDLEHQTERDVPPINYVNMP